MFVPPWRQSPRLYDCEATAQYAPCPSFLDADAWTPDRGGPSGVDPVGWTQWGGPSGVDPVGWTQWGGPSGVDPMR